MLRASSGVPLTMTNRPFRVESSCAIFCCNCSSRTSVRKAATSRELQALIITVAATAVPIKDSRFNVVMGRDGIAQ